MGSDEIATLGDDVNRLGSALSEHETARQRWMSDIAHELRTPLAIISGELEAMSDGIRPLGKEQLTSVREEVTHLASLVDDLHIVYSSPDQSMVLQGDEQRLRQLLHNLLDNSVRYTDAGGKISITLKKTGNRRP